MKIKDIPVRVMGPGSQPADTDGQTLSYIAMPSDMWTYRPPSMPEPEDVSGLAAARESLLWLEQALADYDENREPQLANLSALDEANRELVNQVLGEGEVAVTYSGDFRAHTQESVLAGVWRTLYLDADDRVLFDILEVADAPHTVRVPTNRARAVDTGTDGVPADVANALPILVELQSHCDDYETSGRTHVINLSLLPLSPADLEFLDARLGRGPVDTLSRAYGKCQVISTLTPNVWWVRYYNSMGTLILNTLEVVGVPAVVCAAPEDLRDSAVRLADILEPYWPEDA
jgi:hydrogenase-1 operon protein HyaF